ncbi:pre-mRNA-splicing factor 38B-like, partial [Penaeus monodon]|uniref:pre-mRNA-splicing factor 38B-like n=1 Tax=Penaeus monodon TaxID=6687 RepID=UPI0018A70EA9
MQRNSNVATPLYMEWMIQANSPRVPTPTGSAWARSPRSVLLRFLRAIPLRRQRRRLGQSEPRDIHLSQSESRSSPSTVSLLRREIVASQELALRESVFGKICEIFGEMKAGAYEYEEDGEKGAANKKPNGLPIWGNEKSMNLNPLILTNIQSSQYFKVNLYQLKTYHEVIDEIYYNVTHLEPWEKGSRKTSGQTGMCGGVRGVGAGGIVSTAFCILYKLYTLRLTRKQVTGLLNHSDSPYIRGLGFMYIRYTQPPADLWDWFEPY